MGKLANFKEDAVNCIKYAGATVCCDIPKQLEIARKQRACKLQRGTFAIKAHKKVQKLETKLGLD